MTLKRVPLRSGVALIHSRPPPRGAAVLFPPRIGHCDVCRCGPDLELCYHAASMSRRADSDPIRSLPADHEAFLAELSTRHGTVALRQAEHWLRARGPSFCHRWQRTWTEP